MAERKTLILSKRPLGPRVEGRSESIQPGRGAIRLSAAGETPVPAAESIEEAMPILERRRAVLAGAA